MLLQNFPQLNVLLLDVGYRSDRYLFPLLRKFPNLYFDSSMYVAHRQLEWYLEQFGPDRIVFGSRLPLYTPGAALMALGTARVSDSSRLAVAGGNLRRLIGESL
jgi:predicted TIM-barrel fold metal-dependent hydrolase